MRKNYLKCFLNAYGIMPLVLVVCMFVAAGCVTYLDLNILSNTITGVLSGVLVGLLGGCAILGLSKLRSEKFSLIDFLRLVGLVGSVVLFIMILSTGTVRKLTYIYPILAVVFLVETIIRFKFVDDDAEETSFKHYFGAVAGAYNPVIIMILSVAVAAFLSIAAKNNLSSIFGGLMNYKNLFIGMAAAGVGVILVSSTDKKVEVSLIDLALAVAFIAAIYAIPFTIGEVSKSALLLVGVVGVVGGLGLLARAITYNSGKGYDNPAHKTRTYFKKSYDKYDVTIGAFIALVLVVVYTLPVANAYGENPITQIVGSLNDTISMVCLICGMVITVLLLVAMVIFRGFKSQEITKVDRVLVPLLMGTSFVIPFVILQLVNGAGLDLITGDVLILVTTIIYAVAFLAAVIVQFIRIRSFDPLYHLVQEASKVPAKKEEKYVEEEVKEEVKPAVVENNDPFALTEEDEAIYAAQYGYEEETEEEPAQEEVVEEEVAEEEYVEDEVEQEYVEDEEYEEEVQYVDEDGNILTAEEVAALNAQLEEIEEPVQEEVAEDDDDADDEADEDDDDADDDEEADDEADEEVVEEVNAKEKAIVVQDFQIMDEDGKPKKIKRKFNSRMMFAPYETKEYYNEIRNYLQMYRAKGRSSARCETFRYKGLVAKVALGGKAIKVFLALDPEFIDQNPKYHLKDVSDKKQYADVPVMLKVRSARGLKYFKELVDIMMANRLVKPKRNYQPTNYIPQLIPNGEAILATLGMSTDYLHNMMNVRGIPEEMPNDLIDYIPMIVGEDLEEEEVEANVYLDTLCNHFEDGAEITIDVLKSLRIVTRGNVLRVKARGTLDRKLIIYAEKFDEDALKMLMCTNCTAVRIVRNIEE